MSHFHFHFIIPLTIDHQCSINIVALTSAYNNCVAHPHTTTHIFNTIYQSLTSFSMALRNKVLGGRQCGGERTPFFQGVFLYGIEGVERHNL